MSCVLKKTDTLKNNINVSPELRNSVQCKEEGLHLLCWYGGPEEVQFNSVRVLEGEEQSSTVHWVHLSAGQVDHVIQWPQ